MPLYGGVRDSALSREKMALESCARLASRERGGKRLEKRDPVTNDCGYPAERSFSTMRIVKFETDFSFRDREAERRADETSWKWGRNEQRYKRE